MTDTREIERVVLSIVSSGLNRRRFLQIGALASLAALTSPLRAQQAPYRVGVGRGIDPYTTTKTAIEKSGEWPSVAGRVVVIKPNLVTAASPESGAVTDPHVVRAVVDRALVDGAVFILIVETAPSGALFDVPGYSFFNNYDPGNRVHLVDLQNLNVILASNPLGWIYKKIYVAGLLQLPGIVFINVGKLKTHSEATVTLTSKNLFGLPDVFSYISPQIPAGRFAMHDRGVNQTIVDLNLLRPSHFAIVDGIWGMEGRGPIRGTPIQTNTVLAGKNPLAVDRVGLTVMGIPQRAVRHLNYLSSFGFGPSDLSQIAVDGDSLETFSFEIPRVPPEFNLPELSSATLDPTAGETVSVSTRFLVPCFRKIEVVQVYDDRTDVDIVRTLAPFSFQNIGINVTVWEGRAEDESLVAPGRYAIRVTAYDLNFATRPGAATSWVSVI